MPLERSLLWKLNYFCIHCTSLRCGKNFEVDLTNLGKRCGAMCSLMCLLCRYEECKTKLTPFLKKVGFNPKTGE